MRKLEFTLPDHHDPIPLSTYLRREKQVSSRLLKKLKYTPDGISCNQIPCYTNHLLFPSDVITLRLTENSSSLVPYPASVPILFEDEDYLLFNKPIFMESHPSFQNNTTTLANVFVHHYHQQNLTPPLYHPVGRLDKNTSGLTLVAKHSYGASLASSQTFKVYYALVSGVLAHPKGTLTFPIAPCEDSIITREVSPKGKPATTHYQVLVQKPNYALVKLCLETGRTHQIRVHLSHIGHPLLGDDLYGETQTPLGHHSLHVGEYLFYHPFLHKTLKFHAPFPTYFQDFIPQLEKFSPKFIPSFL